MLVVLVRGLEPSMLIFDPPWGLMICASCLQCPARHACGAFFV